MCGKYTLTDSKERRKSSLGRWSCMPDRTIEALLLEERAFAPPPAFRQSAIARDERVYDQATKDLQGFWARAAEDLHWFAKWRTVLEWTPPNAQWFVGGKTNITYNCVDRHVKAGRRTKAAIIWEGEPGDERVLTYGDLLREVSKFANVLKRLGVKRGDRVTISLPMIPELPIAMLACARIGAPHTVVFGGFSAEALRDRINDAQAKVLITADGGWRRGNIVPLKRNADEALAGTPTIEHVVVVRRVGEAAPIHFQEGRDHWWHRLMADAPAVCEPEPMDSEDLLYILYTSGTTGKPKGIVHTTGGYMVGTYLTTKWIFDLKDDDVFWCTADIGWVTGHSYIVYGPLANPAIPTLKPESATRPFPGVAAEILNEQGTPVGPNEGGYLVLTKPWPAMLRGIYRDPDRYVQQYWSRYPGVYFTGDGAKRDKDGYFWLLGRVDDVINVAGARIGTYEVESALVDNTAVAEAAVIGVTHDIKGQAIAAFVTLKEGFTAGAEMVDTLKQHVVKKIGALARPEQILFTGELPKTRSGKIMRRFLRDIAEGRVVGGPTTLADQPGAQGANDE